MTLTSGQKTASSISASFGGGACPSVEYAGPYAGFHLIESPDYAGLVGMYRWFVRDPIRVWSLQEIHQAKRTAV